MANIKIKHGSEGPKWDPYGFTEIEFTKTDGTVVTYHGGLAEWCKVEYKDGKKYLIDNLEESSILFKLETGLTPDEAEEWYYKMEASKEKQCQECGSRKLEWKSGYPGEELLICSKCGEVANCHFDESAVI